MKFIQSTEMKVDILENQECWLSSKDKIKQNAKRDDTLAFDIYNDDKLIGFAMLREFEKGCFFLWSFAIDKTFQNKGLGKKALLELIKFLKNNYDLKTITTTYKTGNIHAKHLYENTGFTETNRVLDGEIDEVDMELHI